ncbi:serine hydrolase [Spirosoma flavum]|uniref:Serine hydrolase n=1 Tax=Spirosoma flavum TaxID=2048557 RepID=A0ABW6AIF2_9BACT
MTPQFHTTAKKRIGTFLLIFSLVSQQDSLFAQSEPGISQLIKKVESGLIPPVRLQGDSIWSIAERMKHYGVPGLSIAVIKDSKIVWIKSYGVADRDSREPVTSQTLFQAGSISKPVAAYAALKEVERGKLSLDEDVNKYLTSWHLPDNQFTKEKKVALNNLLSHTGGVTVHGFNGYTIDAKIPTLIQVLNGESPANSAAVRVDKAPGKGFRYSGGGYSIVQQMLIDVEGKPFPSIMNELVLQPLGMKSSTYSQPLPASQLKLAATGYIPDGSMTVGKRHTYPEMAAAGLWTTAEELAKFAIDVQLTVQGKSHKVLSQGMVTKMLTPFIEDYIGLGLFIDKRKEDIYFSHGGWDEGFSSNMIAHRDKGYGVVILTNANKPLFINELTRSVAAAYNWPNYLTPVYKKMPIRSADLTGFSGRYRFEEYATIKIYAQGNRLFYQKLSEEPLELFKIADNTFIRRDWEAKVQFLVNPADNQRYLVSSSDGEPIAYKYPLMKDNEKVPFDWILEGQFDKALAAYQQVKEQHADQFTVDEGYINTLGYQLVRSRDVKKAIDMFRINTILYPKSSNAFDSLGEAYMLNGDKGLARKNYALSLELDPRNDNARKMIRKLEVN